MTAVAQALNLFYGYDPHPAARRAFLDNALRLLILAGRRGAKTHTGCRRMLRMIYERDLPAALKRPYSPGAARRGKAVWWTRRPRLHYWVVAATYDLLKEPMRYLLEFLPGALLEHVDSGSHAFWLYPDILIEFKTAHDPQKLVGSGLNGLWIVEAARMSGEAWPGYLEPLLAANGGWAQAETTPLGRDWTYEYFEEPAKNHEPAYSFHWWPTIANTRMPALKDAVERARRLLPPQYFKREYEASREAFIGQIYEPFNRSMVIPAVPAHVKLWRRLGTQDWGFTAPGAHVVLGFSSPDPNLAHVYCVDEIYQQSRLVEDFWVPEVKKKMERWKYSETVADPESPGDIARMRAKGVHTMPHRNYTNSQYDEPERSVLAGIRVLNALMHQGRFWVTENCKNLVRELEGYRWDQHKSGPLGGTLIERPAPGQSDHAATCARYGATYGLKGANFEPFMQAAA